MLIHEADLNHPPGVSAMLVRPRKGLKTESATAGASRTRHSLIGFAFVVTFEASARRTNCTFGHAHASLPLEEQRPEARVHLQTSADDVVGNRAECCSGRKSEWPHSGAAVGTQIPEGG